MLLPTRHSRGFQRSHHKEMQSPQQPAARPASLLIPHEPRDSCGHSPLTLAQFLSGLPPPTPHCFFVCVRKGSPESVLPYFLNTASCWRLRDPILVSFKTVISRMCRRPWHPTPVFSPGESRGRGSLVGSCLWGRTESDTTEAT